MMFEKVNYIHQNPVKRGYIDETEHWRYSSARDYGGVDGLEIMVSLDTDMRSTAGAVERVKFRYFDVHLLEMTHGNEYPKEELEYIESVAKKYLNKETIQEMIKSLEKDEYQYDYPYDKFHQLFKKLLEEKSE